MDRRSFMKAASWGALAQMAGISPLRSMAALAQSSSSNDYKALVCVFLRGGNDSNNLLVPLGSAQYNLYNQARGSVAVQQSNLLTLSNTAYGLHPAFSNLQGAFKGGQAALLANVGPLVQPTTAQQYIASSVATPVCLMSHGDQQEVWELGGYQPGTGASWSGLTADLLSPTYNAPNLPMATVFGNTTSFGIGKNNAPFTAAPANAAESFWCSAGLSCYPRSDAAQQLLNFNNGVSLIQADEQIYKQAYQYNNFYNSVIVNAQPFKTPFPSSNPVMGQLQTVATMMQLRSQIGARRQIFLVNVNGFDTHTSQAGTQAALFAQLDQAVGTFISAMQELGLYQDVTLFTASDFSRTLQINSLAGTDHAWGGHHFVVGGAVKGGAVYGTYPNLQLNGPDDFAGTGSFVPTTALSQYMATLASWFGVPASALPGMLPGLSNFSTMNLGFV